VSSGEDARKYMMCVLLSLRGVAPCLKKYRSATAATECLVSILQKLTVTESKSGSLFRAREGGSAIAVAPDQWNGRQRETRFAEGACILLNIEIEYFSAHLVVIDTSA
jgi:hypothetical protein